MFESLLEKLKRAIDSVSPSAETVARRSALALQQACCALLMEVARLDPASAEQKRQAVARAMRKQFDVGDAELQAMMAQAARPENRLTSYYGPVALINARYAPEDKARLIELLWCVALADGGIDMYEDQLVRKLADLLYVPHVDFILAKHQAQSGAAC